MICIFSRKQDASTEAIMRWLAYFGVKDVLRINSDDARATDEAPFLDLGTNDFFFRYDGRRIHLSDLHAVWYRKGRHWLCNQFPEIALRGYASLTDYLRRKMAKDHIRLSEYLQFLIERTTPVLGSARHSDLNKMTVLYEARQVGLLTPDFCISNSRKSLVCAVAAQPSITKSIGDVIYFFDTEDTNTGYFSYTEDIAESAFSHSAEEVSPSFVQEKISKQFEVRVFFLIDRFYSMAIFSQADKQTTVDFRRYNTAKPNRAVPFRLSPEIEEKLAKLFSILTLNTGSADFVVDQQGRFFFLEINPVGQFGMVSQPCNYYLEKEVAIALMTLSQQQVRTDDPHERQ